jgi:parallel beta-helix repeat protein
LSSNNIVYNNSIINNFEGIVLTSEDKFVSSNNIIYRNEIANSKSYSMVLELSHSNKIYENNFKRKISMSAHIWWIYDMVFYIKYPLKRNQWYNNYWDNPRLSPKLIPGELIWPITKFMYLIRRCYQVDWYPAKQPYDIPVIAI